MSIFLRQIPNYVKTIFVNDIHHLCYEEFDYFFKIKIDICIVTDEIGMDYFKIYH